MKFSIGPGVASLLSSAASDAKAASGFTFYCSGDLCQMSAQESALRSSGIEVQRSNVYPVIKEEDVSKALKIFWDRKVEGWWHYKEDFVKHNICTAEEFNKTLMHQVESKRK